MKLKNKKTGEIAKLAGYVKTGDDRMFFRFEDDKGTYKKEYNSLTELNEEWEDAPEDPQGWAITMYGGISRIIKDDVNLIPDLKEIGNYFNDKESAYDGLEKLKAFKRLRDLGFRFEGIRFRNNHNYIEWKIEPKNELTDGETGELLENLYKVFGGKE